MDKSKIIKQEIAEIKRLFNKYNTFEYLSNEEIEHFNVLLRLNSGILLESYELVQTKLPKPAREQEMKG